MPHLQVEFSRDLSTKIRTEKLLKALVAALSERETVDPRAVKAYARCADHWAMGDGAPPGFLHVTVCVLEGRSEEWESQTADHLYTVLLKELEEAALGASVTLEFRRMEARTYRKRS